MDFETFLKLHVLPQQACSSTLQVAGVSLGVVIKPNNIQHILLKC